MKPTPSDKFMIGLVPHSNANNLGLFDELVQFQLPESMRLKILSATASSAGFNALLYDYDS